MSNRLSMSKIHSIETLHQSGHSNREIARLLSVDRGTVNAYVRRLKSQNRPDPQTGSTVESVEEPSRPETGLDQNRPGHRPQVRSSDALRFAVRRLGQTDRSVRRQLASRFSDN